MKSLLYKLYKYASIGFICLVLGYLVFNAVRIDFSTISVTTINIIATVLVIFIGSPLAIAGIMANDSGKGGFTIGTFQFLTLSYPLVYVIGLISSIVILYSDFENKEEIAIWLALISPVQLLIIVSFFGISLLIEKIDRN